jgi:hypothetical protein
VGGKWHKIIFIENNDNPYEIDSNYIILSNAFLSPGVLIASRN